MEFVETETRYGKLRIAKVTAEYPHDEDEYVHTEECLLVKAANSNELPSMFLIRDDTLLSGTALTRSETVELFIKSALSDNDYITEFIDNHDGTVKLTSQTFNDSKVGNCTDFQPDITENMQDCILATNYKMYMIGLIIVILIIICSLFVAIYLDKNSEKSKTDLSYSYSSWDNTVTSTSNTTTFIDESIDCVTTTTSTTRNYTMGQLNALTRALDYLDVMPFSRSGLIKQLEYEGYTKSEARWAVNNCGANWNLQAVLKAEEYLDFMTFSRSGLIDQLMYEGFSRSQAEYAVDNLGY